MSVRGLFGPHLFRASEEETRRMKAFILETARPCDLALDIGCGTGDSLGRLEAAGFIQRGVGIDLGTPNITAARQKWPLAGLQFIEGDYYLTRFKEPFSLILSDSSLQYQPVQLEKIASDLRGGGFFVAHLPRDGAGNRFKNILRAALSAIPAAWTDRAALFLMKKIYGGRFSEEALKSRLLYLRARVFFWVGKKELKKMDSLGLRLQRTRPAVRTSFWQMDHCFYVWRKEG